MTAQPSAKPANSPHSEPPRAPIGGSIWKWVWTALGVFAVVAVWWNVRNFPDARVGNPAVTGHRGPSGRCWATSTGSPSYKSSPSSR